MTAVHEEAGHRLLAITPTARRLRGTIFTSKGSHGQLVLLLRTAWIRPRLISCEDGSDPSAAPNNEVFGLEMALNGLGVLWLICQLFGYPRGHQLLHPKMFMQCERHTPRSNSDLLLDLMAGHSPASLCHAGHCTGGLRGHFFA